MISEYDKVMQILKKYNIRDLEEIEYGKDCFDELLDYFADEIPYGVMKAREGTPDEWIFDKLCDCLLYTSPSPRDRQKYRMPSSA